MKTTLKKGLGRAGQANGNGHGGQLPPGPLGPIAVYKQPDPPPRRMRTLVLRIFGWAIIVLAMCIGGVAGGAYLYFHQSVAAVAPKSEEVRKAQEKLDVVLPGEPATALVVGYDKRASDGKGVPSRSDTVMLVRADPSGKTISLLSFPRDMTVEIHCPGQGTYAGKINAAYANCGIQGTLETVKALTHVPVNYLVTVNFRGFRQLVDRLDGVWLDVDRRYYNDNGGTCSYCYAKINLQPGYQKLGGYQALDFVRFRHTDSDLFRVARQQQFVRALKDQIDAEFSVTTIPKLVKAVTSNVEVGQGGGGNVGGKTVLRYALLAYSLPPGHVFQVKIDGFEGFADLTTAPENVTRAVQRFMHPDVDSPKKATAVALGEKVKLKTPAPTDTTVTVLNGNGVTGSATNAGYLLGQRGYRILTPPNGVQANAPNFSYFRTKVYFDPSIAGSKQAATKVSNLFGSADVGRMPRPIRTLANGAMLVTVVGQTFHGTLASAPVDQTPEKQEATVVPGTSAAYDLLRERQHKVPFPLMVPTVIDRNSWIDRERPIRHYYMDGKRDHETVRLTYRMGSNEYWGVQMTNWDDAPVLQGRNFVRNIGGRRYELFYDGPHLHMVVLRTDQGSYWVVNTLLNRMSNETMLAVAKGMRPLAKVRR